MSIDRLKNALKKSPIHRCLYHFTDSSNLSSIAKHGLLSKQRMAELGIAPVAPGGNDWSWQADEHKGLLDYISLCLTRNHPMCYVAKSDGRLSDPRYLAISPNVLDTPGIKMALDIANKRDVQIFDIDAAIVQMDLEVLYTRTDWTDPTINARLRAAEKYEILVPREIPINLILRVC